MRNLEEKARLSSVKQSQQKILTISLTTFIHNELDKKLLSLGRLFMAQKYQKHINLKELHPFTKKNTNM